MVGRIETYVHSDNITANKGAAMVKVTCDTDFAAKTPEFIAFSKKVARMAFASGTTEWAQVVEVFPDLETERTELARTLREKVVVEQISALCL